MKALPPAGPTPPTGTRFQQVGGGSTFARDPYHPHPWHQSGSAHGTVSEVPPSNPAYGYSEAHQYYEQEKMAWIRRKEAGSTSAQQFSVKFQLFHELEEPDGKGKHCHPLSVSDCPVQMSLDANYSLRRTLQKQCPR